MTKSKPTPEQLGNNFYKSGWQPSIEVNEETVLEKSHMLEQTLTIVISLMTSYESGDLIQMNTK